MSELMHIGLGPARNCWVCMDLWMFDAKEMRERLQQVDTVHRFIEYLTEEELGFDFSIKRSVEDGLVYSEITIEGADFSALFIKDVVKDTIVEWEIDSYTMTLVAHALNMAQPCDDGFFSASRCPLCDGGASTRYAAHKVWNDHTFDHVDICGDCMLVLEIGG